MNATRKSLAIARALLISLVTLVSFALPAAAYASEVGCADGQREGFVDQARYPNIAGCSGGWSVPGVLVSTPGFAPSCPGVATYDTLTPACGRGAGDDGANANGAGCNVADLCAPGWHVCNNEPEVAVRSSTGCAGATRPSDPPLFFATRQSGTGCGVCASGTSTDASCDSASCALGCLQTTRTSNDLFGCGNLGITPVAGCGVFDRFSNNLCSSLGSPWNCDDGAGGYCEAYVIQKTNASRGGVLCCRDNTNRAPVTNCKDISVTADAGTCLGAGSINAGSHDPDFDAITCEQQPAGGFAPGTTQVTLTCTDARGLSSSCTGTVTVTAPPECSKPVGEPSWVLTGKLARGRILHTAALLDSGKVLVAGGYNWTTELFDPATNTWSATGDALASHRYHTMTKLPDGRVLIAGGGQCPTTGATAELYVPTTGRWRPTGNLLTNRGHHVAALLPSGKVLVAGGEDTSGNPLASAELYDPATGTWSATGSMGTARSDFVATVLPSGLVLVAGGANASTGFLASAELYDPATGTWSATGSMGAPRRFHAATALGSGKVLVTGGGNNAVYSASAELYDAATGTWTATDAMTTPRRYHTATRLPSGKVLVAGGYHDYTGILTSSEVYDPATQRWTTTVSMNVDRYSQTATLLNDGRVLAVGGVSNRDQASSEWYGLTP